MHAEIFALGSELTTGAKLDTNSQWLSVRLAARGIETRFHHTARTTPRRCWRSSARRRGGANWSC